MNLLASSAWDTFVKIFNGPITNIHWEDELIALLRVFIAGFLGLLVGLERAHRQKEAGIATHFVVASASALFTCISTSIAAGTDAGIDGERIAAQVVTGVGFLGAGIIFFRRESLRGLTTAAGIWATAAIGMSVAAGQIIVAAGFVALYITLQVILHSKRIKRHNIHMLLVKFAYTKENETRLMDNFGVNSFHRVKLIKLNDKTLAEAVIYPKKKFLATELYEFMSENPEIESIERLEDL